jgi:hypothetical protein
MTSDGGFVDETRGNNKPVAQASQASPPPAAPESADLSEVGQKEMDLRANEEDELNKARIESPEGPEASAIKAVTETPPDVNAAPGPPEEENNIEVGAELETRDESIGPPNLRRVKGDLAEPETGETMVVGSDGVAKPKGGRRSFKKRLPRLL